MAEAAEFKKILGELTDRRDLSAEATDRAMSAIFAGEWTQAQIAGFLIALKMKGETPDEIAAAAKVMRRLASPVKVADAENLLDTAGTGGDGARTFNISTAAAVVAAACGARVAKHGNRAISGASGSSDFFAEFGADINLTPEKIAQCIERVGLGFIFAPNHHGAMRHAAPVRRELGARTLFNLLGPLANPAGAGRQLTGVFDRALILPYARTLAKLGCRRALVVHGGGLDEISVCGKTDAAELTESGKILEMSIAPEDFGLTRASSLDSLRAESAAESKAIVERVFAGESGPPRDAVLLNAGAAVYVAGLADEISDGIAQAARAVDDGIARRKLDEFVKAARSSE